VKALLAALLVAAPACVAAQARGPAVETVTMHWSRFDRSAISVRRGVPVRFVLVNDDPIDHELIVGDAAMQERHEKGAETHHGARPTERSVPALSTVETTVTFDAAGTLFFACHLPGHYAYGMRGIVHVT
jgi:uncharacterized cupredoxin-like copper-binding protein